MILLLVVLTVGIWLGFMIGFSKALRAAAFQMQRPRRRLIGIIITSLGGFGVAVACVAALYSWNFRRTAERTTGSVTGLREQAGSDSGPRVFAPIVSFIDASGGQHTIESTLYQSPVPYRVGESVGVLYQPKAPKRARIDGYSHLWGVTTISGLLGLLYVIVGSTVIFWPRLIDRWRGKARTP